jgi:hypothetical protein
VLFGGMADVSPHYADTWEWNGSTWLQATPPVSPSPRRGHALAFDPVQGRVLLFGGAFSVLFANYFGDTWAFDGFTWTQEQPASNPPPRSLHAMAADLQRRRIVLFGGGSNVLLGDTWEWDGTNWSQITPASSPGTRFGHALTYDVGRGRAVLFGGADAAGVTNVTWEWDGSVWTQVATTSAPAMRQEYAMAYDGELQRLVALGYGGVPSTWLYGGVDDASSLPVGVGCAGTAGVPQLVANDPFLGNGACAVDLLRARANAPALIGLALASNALPLGGGCTLYLRDAVPMFVVTNGDGFAGLRLPLPFDQGLRGLQVYAQGAVLDPQGALGGVAVSAGLVLRLGD